MEQIHSFNMYLLTLCGPPCFSIQQWTKQPRMYPDEAEMLQTNSFCVQPVVNFPARHPGKEGDLFILQICTEHFRDGKHCWVLGRWDESLSSRSSQCTGESQVCTYTLKFWVLEEYTEYPGNSKLGVCVGSQLLLRNRVDDLVES